MSFTNVHEHVTTVNINNAPSNRKMSGQQQIRNNFSYKHTNAKTVSNEELKRYKDDPRSRVTL